MVVIDQLVRNGDARRGTVVQQMAVDTTEKKARILTSS